MRVPAAGATAHASPRSARATEIWPRRSPPSSCSAAPPAHLEPVRDGPEHHLPGLHAVPDCRVLQNRPASIVRPPAPTDLIASRRLQRGAQLVFAAGRRTFTVKRATSLTGTYDHRDRSDHGRLHRHHRPAGTIYFYVVMATQNSVTSADSALAPGILAGTTTWQTQDIGAVGATGALISRGVPAHPWLGRRHLGYGGRVSLCLSKLERRRHHHREGRVPAKHGAWAKAGLMIRESLDASSTPCDRLSLAIERHRPAAAHHTGGSGSGVTNITGSLLPTGCGSRAPAPLSRPTIRGRDDMDALGTTTVPWRPMCMSASPCAA